MRTTCLQIQSSPLPSSHWSLLGSGALLGFAWTSGPLYRTAGILALSWGFGLLLAWGVGRKCWVPVIPAIGVYSYSIYLWQQPFAAAVYGTTVSLPMFWILLVSAILLGMVMAHVVEFPVLRVRERLIPKEQLLALRPKRFTAGLEDSSIQQIS